MNIQKKQHTTLKNFLWRFMERCGAQCVSMIVTIVLARILDPKVYGSIALVTVLISFLQVFVDSGLGTSLIQKKDADDLDFSTVFYTKLIICLVIYVLLFFSAPYISKFYEMPELTAVIRVLGISIMVAGVKNVEQAYVSRHLLFKCFFYSTIIGTLISAVVGICMALSGFGIWALVAQMLTNEFIDTIMLWFTVKWRPKKCFSFLRLRQLFSFGWKIMIAGILDSTYESLRQLIIGKKYPTEELAYYNKGKQFPSIIVVNLSTACDSVLLPTMSNVQDVLFNVKALVRKSIVISGYILLPMMFGLCTCAEPFIYILLGDKWTDSIVFVQVFSIAYAFYSINSAFKNGIKAIGNSKVFLITEIIKKTVGIILVVVCIKWGSLAIALSFLASSVINIVINIIPNIKYLRYSLKEQLSDIFPALLSSVVMYAVVYPINLLIIPYWIKLFIIIALGISIYFMMGAIFKMSGYLYCMNILKGIIHKKEVQKDID